MSSKKLYERLVGQLLTAWAELHPMVEWVGPEENFAILVREIKERRACE